MTRREREQVLIDELRRRGEMDIAAAMDVAGISEATARRHFQEIEKRGFGERFWGGIRGTRPLPTGPPAFARRLEVLAREKTAIARGAAELIADGAVVMIDGGTTTFRLCEFLALRPIRIVTNSWVIAQAVDEIRGCDRGAEVLLCGGIAQPESGLVAGPPAEDFLRRRRADWALMSAAGVDRDGVSNYDQAVLGSERVMLQRAAKVALLVDHGKLGVRAMSRLCPLCAVDVVVTNRHGRRRPLLRHLEREGVEVRTVGPEGASGQ